MSLLCRNEVKNIQHDSALIGDYIFNLVLNLVRCSFSYKLTIKGGSRRAEKSRKALMMMSARLWWTRAVRNSESKIVFMLAA